jgi:hypothetical protein
MLFSKTTGAPVCINGRIEGPNGGAAFAIGVFGGTDQHRFVA